MYGKIFESIYEGSLYGHFEAIVTFQALIVLADEDGLIDISPQALAGKTSIPEEVIKKGLKVLQQSDPHSRSQAEDGKRLVLLDEGREFGWRIVNYQYYRDLSSRQETREKARERKRRQRERDSQVVDSEGCHSSVTARSRMSRHTDTDTDTEEKRGSKKSRKTRLPPDWELPDDWLLWAKEHHPSVEACSEAEVFKDHWTAKGELRVSWLATWRNWIRRAEKFGEKNRGSGGEKLSAVEEVRNATGGRRF